jgi:hypothetical protein
LEEAARLRDDIDDLEIPIAHQAIRENLLFLDRLVLKVVKGWSFEDVSSYLAEQGYRPETQRRFIAAVRLRYARLDGESKRRRKAKSETDDHSKGEGGEANATS